jgi:RNA polymerase sigma-70 factor, ECF subfamily
MATPEHRLHAVEDVAEPAADEARTRLEHLYGKHGQRVYAICIAVLRDRHEAEDAAQQVFVSAFRALLRGAEPRDCGAWLATIARHESWARARRQPIVPLQPELPDTAQEDPSTLALQRAELERVWRAIGDLPASQRDALLLREVRGLGYDELVADLQLSRPSVRSLLNRARRTLRNQLEKGTAALTGAPWLTLFGRVVADASSPALSSASRTAAVGLGALAITGGAVVAPSLTGHAQQQTAGRPSTHLSVSPTSPSAPADRVDVVTLAPTQGVPKEHGGTVRQLHEDHGSRRGSDGSPGDGDSRSDRHGGAGSTSAEGGPGNGDTSGTEGGSDAVSRSGDDASRALSGSDRSGDTSQTTGTVASTDGDTRSTDETPVVSTSSSDGSSGSSGESALDGGSTSDASPSTSDGGGGDSSSGSSGSDGSDTSGGS